MRGKGRGEGERSGERGTGEEREKKGISPSSSFLPLSLPFELFLFSFQTLMIFPFPDLLDGFRGLETFRKRTKTTKRTVECPTGQTITLKGLQTNQILRFRIISGKKYQILF